MYPHLLLSDINILPDAQKLKKKFYTKTLTFYHPSLYACSLRANCRHTPLPRFLKTTTSLKQPQYNFSCPLMSFTAKEKQHLLVWNHTLHIIVNHSVSVNLSSFSVFVFHDFDSFRELQNIFSWNMPQLGLGKPAMFPIKWQVTHFWQKYHRSVVSFSIQYTRRHMVSIYTLLGKLILITCLRFCLPGFSTVRSLFSPL